MFNKIILCKNYVPGWLAFPDWEQIQMQLEELPILVELDD